MTEGDGPLPTPGARFLATGTTRQKTPTKAMPELCFTPRTGKEHHRGNGHQAQRRDRFFSWPTSLPFLNQTRLTC